MMSVDVVEACQGKGSPVSCLSKAHLLHERECGCAYGMYIGTVPYLDNRRAWCLEYVQLWLITADINALFREFIETQMSQAAYVSLYCFVKLS